DSECTVSWGAPVGLYEMLYDDGTPENYSAWEFAGNRNAVKFTPQGYPATITGAKIYICNTGFGNPIGSTFSVLVCKPDAAGMPGEVIDSVSATVNTTGLVSVTGLDAMVTTGDFFMVMVQTTPQPNCPYVGVDETLPTAYKSYSQDVLNGGAWALSAYQDFMIHAIVSGPASGGGDKMESKAANLPATDEMKAIINTPVEGFDNSAGVSRYDFNRIFLGATNPVTPPNGVFTLINNAITGTTYIDGGSTWYSLTQGWYCYGIKAVYPNGQQSDYAFTNYVHHKHYADLTIHALLGCDSVPAEGAIVKLSGAYYPYYSLTDTLPASGTLTFSQIIQGDATLTITYPGYNNYTQAIALTDTLEVNAVLGQALNKPINLQVDLNTLQANWQQPRGILMSQDFEGSQFPPIGWQVSTQGIAGWVSTTNGSSDSLVIPPHTKYAVVNDELGGPTNNGCCDYLITPAIDLRGAPDYTLTFNSFYNGFGNQHAYVEMSTDSGVSWIPIYTCQLANQWYGQTVDLSPYSGAGGLASVKFAFHANDAGNQASGWAIDDVSINYGGLAVSGYKVFLDGAEVGQTVETHWDFDPLSLLCGQAYQVGVSAIYCSGESDVDTLGFTNYFAYPPTNLSADTIVTATSGAVMLSWDVPLYCMANAVYFHIYRDDMFLTQVPLTDTAYLDLNLMPKSYCYTVTTVYDLTPFGFPGLLAESIKSDTACADIIYGGDLPFGDDFSSGGFDTTLWNPGQNWLVDNDSDNPVPAAKFKWDPLMTNYSSALQSTMINISGIDTVSPFKIYFNYEIKLQDSTSTGNEKLAVEIWDGAGWQIIKEYTNSGSFDWTWEHLEITDFIGDYAFMVRFRANGDSSSGIRYWAIDNVHIYYTETYFLPPMNLVVNPSGSFGNENHLIWEPPYTGSSDQSYILDDNTVEFSTSYNATGECWLGNEFQVSETGLLHSVSLFMEA
ncbi:MAG: choice-of-anchor J domain-containing protein, partial [Bacteroidales bacterium]